MLKILIILCGIVLAAVGYFEKTKENKPEAAKGEANTENKTSSKEDKKNKNLGQQHLIMGIIIVVVGLAYLFI